MNEVYRPSCSPAVTSFRQTNCSKSSKTRGQRPLDEHRRCLRPHWHCGRWHLDHHVKASSANSQHLQPAPAAQHLLHASQLRHLQPSPTSPLLLRSALNARLSGKGLVTARREWCAFFRDPPEEWRTARRLLRSSAARDDCGCLTRAGRGINHNNSIWTAGLGFKAHGRLVSGPLAPHP